DDELPDLRRPVRILRRLCADARALGEVLIAPHVDDLVQGADFGVPEGGERRVLLPVLVGLAVPLLHLGEAPGLERVRPELVDHRRPPFPWRGDVLLRGTALPRRVCASVPETSRSRPSRPESSSAADPAKLSLDRAAVRAVPT